MPSPRLSSLALPCVLVGCAFPQLAEDGSTSTGGAGETASTTGAVEAIHTVTGDGGAPGSTGVGGAGTTGEPEGGPPMIVGFALTPEPIESNGPIVVSATAERADRVRVQLDTGDALELDMSEPGVFSGEIAVHSGFDNGSHVALLTPWRDMVSGETVEAPYAIALPEPGTQGHWETGNLIGQGQVAAIAMMSDGDVVELGTSFTNQGARCYTRRRDGGGAWGQSDVVQIFADQTCKAIDLVVDAQGEISVLVELEVGDETRWRLARLSAWGAEPESRGFGGKDETAVALALHPSGEIAVCGVGKTPSLDDDALAWTFPPGLSSEAWAFDYQPTGKDMAHQISERTRDCVFVGDTLTLVGEANGKHDGQVEFRDRLFILRADDTLGPRWHIAPAGDQTQSGGQAVDVDDLGRLVIGAFTCDDACQPEGWLRIYDDADELVYLAPLGSFPATQFAVRDLAWSPAGYAVVATGGLKGNEAAFTVRAFDPMKIEPVWTFARKDGGVFHTALALAIGLFGEVYAGGIGESSYPAFAIVNG